MITFVLLQALGTAATPPPTRFELPNGLRVWVQEDHARPVALVQVTYKAGSINEQPGSTGIAHYVEHMVYRATKNIRNEDIYGYIDRIGGRYTGGTWPEFTRYGETVPSWALESALRVTAERMCCALFDSTEFERERNNVVTEANGFSDTDPVNALRDAVMYAAFEVHPYRLNSNTWARDNLVLTRDEAFEWYKRYYGPNNAVLVVVGDVVTEHVRALVEKHFASIARAPESGAVRIVEPPQRLEKRVRLTYPGVAQQMEIVYHAPQASHRDFPALVVTDRVLRNRLRASAGTTRITTSDSASQYPYVYRIAVRGDTTADLERVLATIQSEVDRLARESVSADELAAAKGDPPSERTGRGSGGSGQSSTVPPRRSNLTRLADQLTDREALPWEVTQALRDRVRLSIAGVTADDVQRFAGQWLRVSQRTVGILVPGRDDFAPTWSDGRGLVGERMVIPPLTTPPAKRRRPEPVPAQALRPLEPIPIQTARRVLRNGVVVRVAHVQAPVFAAQLRADSGAASDSGGHVDIRRSGPLSEAPSALAALARAAADQRLAGVLTVAVVAGSGTELGGGARNAAELLEFVAREFAMLSRPPALPPAARTQRATPRDTAIFHPAETQVSIVARLPGVPRDHPDRRALELLNYIVGVPSYGGRLGWALTKSGLTYAAAARTHFAAAVGEISLTTTADTRNAAATVQAIREVVAGIAANGVEGWELQEAQAFTLGRATLYGPREDSPAEVIAAALLESETNGLDQLDPPALSRAYLAVTLEQINRVAKMYYRPELLSVTATGAIPPRDDTKIFPTGTFRAIFEP